MLLLSRSDVARVLAFDDYVQGVEEAFRLHAQGRSLSPQLMHVDVQDGEFHVKGGGLFLERSFLALKANGSFFRNPVTHRLPAIQGAILLFDAATGVPLALLESGEITAQRTGAATAVAARWLARPCSRVATICGCGRQGHVQLRALRHVLPIDCVHAWDADPAAADTLATAARSAGLSAHVASDLASAVGASDVVVTCTPSRHPFVRRAHARQARSPSRGPARGQPRGPSRPAGAPAPAGVGRRRGTAPYALRNTG
jgi:ornithine cyclodeaminase/alanine dehydrogenase